MEKAKMFSQIVILGSLFVIFQTASADIEAKKQHNHGTAAEKSRLVQNLFQGYDKRVNPDDVKLKFGVVLTNFEVKEKESALDTNVWLRYVWQDERLKWDPQEYGNLSLIRLTPDHVWKPDITLYNSADPVRMGSCWEPNVLIYSKGEILWVPPCKLTSECKYTLNVEPYGEQTCTLKFGSWTFDGNILDLEFYNAKSEVDLEYLKFSTSGFEITSTTGARNVRYYSCCTEPYVDLTFNMTMKRIPGRELEKL